MKLTERQTAALILMAVTALAFAVLVALATK